jgi:hypothetical protein
MLKSVERQGLVSYDHSLFDEIEEFIRIRTSDCRPSLNSFSGYSFGHCSQVRYSEESAHLKYFLKKTRCRQIAY